MTDIIDPDRKSAESVQSEMPVAGAEPRENPFWYVEALFFAYRDFTSEPDRILREIGFGRAHHRVLHFVYRYPGMRVAGLLDILQITKQSLARVLRELIKEGYITQQAGREDKRERRLYVTDSGAALAKRLVASQLVRLHDALEAVGEDGQEAVARFLKAMVGEKTHWPAEHTPETNEKEPVGRE